MQALTRAQARIIWGVIAVLLAGAVAAALAGAAAVPADPRSPTGTVFLLVSGPLVAVDLVLAYWFPSRARWSAIPPGASAPPGQSRLVRR